MQKKRMPSLVRMRPFFVPADHDHAAADRDPDVLGLDARQLDQQADGLAVVEDVDVGIPGGGRRRRPCVGLDERGEEAVQLPWRRESSTIGP